MKRVAKTYLLKDNGTIGVYKRKAGAQAEEEPAELKALPPELQGMVKGQLKALKSKLATMDDPKALQEMLDKMRAQKDSAPDPVKKVFPIFEKEIEARMKQLESSKEGGK